MQLPFFVPLMPFLPARERHVWMIECCVLCVKGCGAYLGFPVGFLLALVLSRVRAVE